MSKNSIKDIARMATNNSKFLYDFDCDYKSYEQGYLDGSKKALSMPFVGKRFFCKGLIIGLIVGNLATVAYIVFNY